MTYIISKADSEIDWGTIPKLQIDNVLWLEDTGIRAYGQICYNEEKLFVHLSAAERNIRAEYTKPLSPVHEDSCLEFFFKLNGTENYFNFEINPNGCPCIQFGPDRSLRLDLVKRNYDVYFDIRTNRTVDGWEVFYQIPLSFFRLFYPEYRLSGDLWVNLYKCGDRTPSPHFLSWAPIDLPKPDFHCPVFFQKIEFE